MKRDKLFLDSSWFESFSSERDYIYFLSIRNYKSVQTKTVPQGSILAALLFNIYMLPLIEKNKTNTEVYINLSPGNYNPIKDLNPYVALISGWMIQNFLQLNTDKTEVVVFRDEAERSEVLVASFSRPSQESGLALD